MKELNIIEQKAQRYDEAIERANELNYVSDKDSLQRKTVEHIFPELAESEDERIRKAIRTLILSASKEQTTIVGVTQSDMLAYLEKQGEQKIDDDDKAILENWEGIVKDNKEKWQLSDWFVEATLSLVQKIKHIGLSKSIVYNNKTLLNACINTLRNVGHPHLAAWLEKQGEIIKEWSEMKINNIQTELQEMVDLKQKTEQGEQKPADKVEPKFHEGEWISGYYTNYKVLSVNNDGYVVEDVDGNKTNILFENEKFHHLFNITDAKDGDVLAAHECLVLFKEIYGLNIKCYCTYHYMGSNPSLFVDTLQNKTAFQPATKEQRDTLMKAMADAGYTFDFDKKELKKIEQNPAWSEEDERMYRRLHNLIYSTPYCYSRKELSDWFKSLRPKPQWKPSDEQMMYLSEAIDVVTRAEKFSIATALKELREQLKNL